MRFFVDPKCTKQGMSRPVLPGASMELPPSIVTALQPLIPGIAKDLGVIISGNVVSIDIVLEITNWSSD